MCKFVTAAESGSKRAAEAVVLIGELYKIEKDIKEADYSNVEEVKEHRLEHSVPQLNKIKSWLREKALQTPLKKGDFPEALHYCLNHFENLTQYAHNPVFDIDNNIVERSIRQIAVGRRNWLFAGSEEGARRSALMYSLIGTCKMHDVEPYEYLNDVIARVAEYPKENLHHLLPDLWKVHFKKSDN